MHTDAKLYYAMLGLDPACSDEEIRAAFRRRAKALHPDTESGDATSFIRLKRAYDTLIDPAKRARYDRASTPRRRVIPPHRAPTPQRVRPPNPGGMSFARYCAAFLFIGGLSLGAIEAMINYADVPPAASPGPTTLAPSATNGAASTKNASRSTESSLSRAGFWDTSNPTSSHAPSEARSPGGTAASAPD